MRKEKLFNRILKRLKTSTIEHDEMIKFQKDVSKYGLILSMIPQMAIIELERELENIDLDKVLYKADMSRKEAKKKELEKFSKSYKDYITDICQEDLDEFRKSKSFHGSKSEIKALLNAINLGVNDSTFPSLSENDSIK